MMPVTHLHIRLRFATPLLRYHAFALHWTMPAFDSGFCTYGPYTIVYRFYTVPSTAPAHFTGLPGHLLLVPRCHWDYIRILLRTCRDARGLPFTGYVSHLPRTHLRYYGCLPTLVPHCGLLVNVLRFGSFVHPRMPCAIPHTRICPTLPCHFIYTLRRFRLVYRRYTAPRLTTRVLVALQFTPACLRRVPHVCYHTVCVPLPATLRRAFTFRIPHARTFALRGYVYFTTAGLLPAPTVHLRITLVRRRIPHRILPLRFTPRLLPDAAHHTLVLLPVLPHGSSRLFCLPAWVVRLRVLCALLVVRIHTARLHAPPVPAFFFAAGRFYAVTH